MRQTKYVVTQFTFYDRTGIQRMLEKQARKGWLLESIHPFAWKYRRIEPKKLHFAVIHHLLWSLHLLLRLSPYMLSVP